MPNQRYRTSEFTKKAFDGHVKGMADLLDVKQEFVYQMLAGKHPDYLDRGRRVHRALCIENPEAAQDYRNLLSADAEAVGGRHRQIVLPVALRSLRREFLTEFTQALNALDECEINEASDSDLVRWDAELADVIRKAQDAQSLIRAARRIREAEQNKKVSNLRAS